MSADRPKAATFTPALLGLVWTAMFGFSAFFFSYATTVSIAVINGLSTVTGGSVLTTMMLGVITAQPFAPWVGRAFGLKGALFLALGLQLLGQILGLTVPVPLLGLVLAGLSGGVGFGLFVVLANAAVPATTAPGRIGKALGIFGGITALAAALGAPFGLWLVGTVPVWSFRLIMCGCLLLAVPTVLKFLPGRPAAAAEEITDPTEAAPTSDDPTEVAPVSDDPTEVTVRSSTAADGGSGRRPRRSLGEALGLVVMLSPFLMGMIVFGIIVGFGPGEHVVGAALFIGSMQVSAVVGRFVAGAITDSFSPFVLNLLGITLVVIGLVATVVAFGAPLFLTMMIIGLGLGTLQSASLVMAFADVSTPARASVAWNMNFDIGLAIAGVVGGLGYTYLGDSATFLVCALLLLLAGALSWILHTPRPSQ